MSAETEVSSTDTEITIVESHRGSDGHPRLVFTKLRIAVECESGERMTHWATCPELGEPILMGFRPVPMGGGGDGRGD